MSENRSVSKVIAFTRDKRYNIIRPPSRTCYCIFQTRYFVKCKISTMSASYVLRLWQGGIDPEPIMTTAPADLIGMDCLEFMLLKLM